MDLTGKQLLIAMIIEHAVLIWLFFKFALPKINRIESWIGTIGANQDVLGKHDKIINSKLDKLVGEMPQ